LKTVPSMFKSVPRRSISRWYPPIPRTGCPVNGSGPVVSPCVRDSQYVNRHPEVFGTATVQFSVGMICGCTLLLSRPTFQKKPNPSGSVLRASLSAAFRALKVVPRSVDDANIILGMPPRAHADGDPAASAHSWNATKIVPLFANAAVGNAFD